MVQVGLTRQSESTETTAIAMMTMVIAVYGHRHACRVRHSRTLPKIAKPAPNDLQPNGQPGGAARRAGGRRRAGEKDVGDEAADGGEQHAELDGLGAGAGLRLIQRLGTLSCHPDWGFCVFRHGRLLTTQPTVPWVPDVECTTAANAGREPPPDIRGGGTVLCQHEG